MCCAVMSSLISSNYRVTLCKASPSPGVGLCLHHCVLHRWRWPDQVRALQDQFRFECLAQRYFDMLLAESPAITVGPALLEWATSM